MSGTARRLAVEMLDSERTVEAALDKLRALGEAHPALLAECGGRLAGYRTTHPAQPVDLFAAALLLCAARNLHLTELLTWIRIGQHRASVGGQWRADHSFDALGQHQS